MRPQEVAARLRELADLLAPPPAAGSVVVDAVPVASFGAELVVRERARQIAGEGHTLEMDRAHNQGNELAWGAYSYLERAAQDRLDQDDPSLPHVWPWRRSEWKPKPTRIRNLVVAAALIVAEVDRRLADGEEP